MIDKGQWWEFGQDTGDTPLLLTRSAMGFLMTTESQDLDLTSYPKDGWEISHTISENTIWELLRHIFFKTLPTLTLDQLCRMAHIIQNPDFFFFFKVKYDLDLFLRNSPGEVHQSSVVCFTLTCNRGFDSTRLFALDNTYKQTLQESINLLDPKSFDCETKQAS